MKEVIIDGITYVPQQAAREAGVIDEDASRAWCRLNGFTFPEPAAAEEI